MYPMVAFVLTQALAVEARRYNPSCPGYFSVALLDAGFHYEAPEFVSRVQLRYSFREAWTQQSWARSATDVDFEQNEGGGWTLDLGRLEVAARSSYTMSHMEFAIRMPRPSGEVIWDNGGLAALGFYSFELPPIQCGPQDFGPISVRALPAASAY